MFVCMSVYFIQTCHNHRGADVRLSILHFIKWDDDEMSPTILNTPTINIKNWTGISCEQMQKITTSCTCTCSMPAVNVIISVSIEWSKTKTIISSFGHETHLHHSWRSYNIHSLYKSYIALQCTDQIKIS